jgi:hypothetical protein
VKDTYERGDRGENIIIVTLLTLEITMENDWIDFRDLGKADLVRLRSCDCFRIGWNAIKIHFKLNGRFDDEEKSDANPLKRKNDENELRVA